MVSAWAVQTLRKLVEASSLQGHKQRLELKDASFTVIRELVAFLYSARLDTDFVRMRGVSCGRLLLPFCIPFLQSLCFFTSFNVRTLRGHIFTAGHIFKAGHLTLLHVRLALCRSTCCLLLTRYQPGGKRGEWTKERVPLQHGPRGNPAQETVPACQQCILLFRRYLAPQETMVLELQKHSVDSMFKALVGLASLVLCSTAFCLSSKHA